MQAAPFFFFKGLSEAGSREEVNFLKAPDFLACTQAVEIAVLCE